MPDKPIRVLGRVRLSRDTDESTSVERQQEVIQQWADQQGYVVVAWAIDVDFSRGLDPFDAPELGPWLTDEKAHEFDIIAVWKLDRLGAGSIILNKVMSWCSDRGKTLVSVTENLDFSTWIGRMVANVIAGVAEGELEAIRERTQGSYKKLRALGRWPGGTPPFGFRAVPRKPEGWELEQHPEEAQIVSQIVDRILDGESVNGTAKWLDARGVKPRRAKRWSAIQVKRLVTGKAILGQSTHKGKLLLDDDGMPRQYAEKIIDEQTQGRVIQKLTNRSVKRKYDHGVALLLNVAECGECKEPLYRFVKEAKGNRYMYYRCAGRTKRKNDCPAPYIPAQDLDDFTGEKLLQEIGDYERTEPVFIPASGDSAELEQVERAIEGVRKERDLGLYDDDEDGYLSRLKTLVERRKALSSSEPQPARWERRGTGETYAEAWRRMDTPERRELLLEAGIVVTAAAKPLRLDFYVPADTLQEFIPSYGPSI